MLVTASVAKLLPPAVLAQGVVTTEVNQICIFTLSKTIKKISKIKQYFHTCLLY